MSNDVRSGAAAAIAPSWRTHLTRSERRLTIALCVVAAGALALIVSFTSLTWFVDPEPEGGQALIPFRELDSGEVYVGGFKSGFTSTYFSWFAITAATICVLVAVVANLSPYLGRWLRRASIFLALAAVGCAFLAVPVTSFRSYSGWLENSDAGFFAAVAGFLLCGLGALLAPDLQAAKVAVLQEQQAIRV